MPTTNTRSALLVFAFLTLSLANDLDCFAQIELGVEKADTTTALDRAKPSTRRQTKKSATNQLKQDIELADRAMKALRSSPADAVRLATRRLSSTADLEPRLRARLCWIAGSGCCYVGRSSQALKHLEEAEKLARDQKDDALLRRTLRFAAAAHHEVGNFIQGSDAAREAIELSEKLEDTSSYPALLHNELAGNEARLQNYKVAIAHFQKALEIAQEHKNRGLTTMVQHNMTDVLTDFGRHAEAAEEYEKVLNAARKADNNFLLAAGASSLGTLYLQLGDDSQASELLEESWTLSQEHDWKHIQAISLLGLGELDWASGLTSEGTEKLESALGIFDELGDSASALSVEAKLTSLRDAKKRAEDKIEELLPILAEAELGQDRRLQADITRQLANAAEEAGQFQDSNEYLRTAHVLDQVARDAADEGELEKLRSAFATSEQKAQLDIQAMRLSETRRLVMVLIVGLVVVLLGSVLLWFLLRARTKLALDLKAATDMVAEQSAKRLELERKLGREEREESLSMLAAGIAHDFNNLLTAISGSAQFGQMASESDKKDQMLHQVVNVTEQASSLTKQLVQYLGGGEERGTMDPAGGLRTCQAMLETLCRNAEGKSLDVRFSCEPGMVALSEVQFQQVVVNILANAIEASPSGGRIKVRLGRQEVSEQELKFFQASGNARAGEYFCLSVEDQGEGVPSEVKNRMFDPYYSTRSQSRGLGLSTVLGIVQSCQGAIDVGDAEVCGAVIKVYLPVCQRNSEVKSEDSVVKTHSSHLLPAPKVRDSDQTILLVDDEDLILQSAATLINAHDINVRTADSALSALVELDEGNEEIGCVVTDLSMPMHSGVWLAEKIAEKWPNIPVILYSGCVDNVLNQGELPIAHFVQKPFKAEELVPLIHATIEKSQNRQSV